MGWGQDFASALLTGMVLETLQQHKRVGTEKITGTAIKPNDTSIEGWSCRAPGQGVPGQAEKEVSLWVTVISCIPLPPHPAMKEKTGIFRFTKSPNRNLVVRIGASQKPICGMGSEPWD